MRTISNGCRQCRLDADGVDRDADARCDWDAVADSDYLLKFIIRQPVLKIDI